VCCVKCDKIIWQQKITMTEAIKKYSIKKEDLFGGVLPSTLGGPLEEAGSKDGIIPPRRGLRYGQFIQNNTFTTMFMEEDVRWLAAKKHGIEDIDEYLNTKSDKCESRRAKKEENKFKRKNHFHRLAEQNGLDPTASFKRFECHILEQRKCSAMTWVRGDLLLKKLGITYVDNHNAPPYRHIDMAPSDSRCYEFLERLMKSNLFIEFDDFRVKRNLEWGGDEFRFKRILYLVKSNDPERQGQYDYRKSLKPEAGDLDPTYDAYDDVFYDTDTRSGYGMIPITGIKDALIDGIPIKNYATDFDSDLEQMIFHRRGYTGEVYQYMAHDSIPKLRVYGIAEWADPIDYCLFEAFIQQFSREGVEPPTFSYAQLRDIWRAREVAEMGDVLGAEECRPFNTPWSWWHYPVYLQDVTYENSENPNPPAPTYSYHPALNSGDIHYSTPLSQFYFGKNARKYIDAAKAETENRLQEEMDAAQRNWDTKREEEQGKINAKNLAEEAKWLRTEAAIFAVVEMYGWDLLAEDGGRAWERAIRVALAGMEFKADVKGKGKGKAKAPGEGRGKR